MIEYYLVGWVQLHGLIYIYLTNYNNSVHSSIIFRNTDTINKNIYKITNRSIALTHAIVTIFASGLSLFIENNLNYDSDNTSLQIHIMNLSLSYFIIDLLHLILMEWNIIFILHHLISIILFSSILNFQITGYTIMLAIFYGEITNPIRMLWIELSKKNNIHANSVLTVFKVSFIGVRLIIIPYYMCNAIHYYIYESTRLKNVLYPIITLYIMVFSLISYGNVIWSYKLLKTKNTYSILENPE